MGHFPTKPTLAAHALAVVNQSVASAALRRRWHLNGRSPVSGRCNIDKEGKWQRTS